LWIPRAIPCGQRLRAAILAVGHCRSVVLAPLHHACTAQWPDTRYSQRGLA